MSEVYTVTLSSHTYEQGRLLTPARRQAVDQAIEDITSQPSRYIERRPEVQGGDACITGTRVPVWVLAAMPKQSDTVEDILQAYDNLTAAQVHAAFSYYYDHRAEIDTVIAVQNARHIVARKADLEP